MKHEKFRILFAEDDKTLISTLHETLTYSGYEVITAFNGAETLAVLKNMAVDVMILDINMPDMSGLEVLKFVKKNFPAVKVIMFTAYADIKNTVASNKLHADSIINKPCDIEDLLAAIERVLESVPLGA